jgi:hypothetical protein
MLWSQIKMKKIIRARLTETDHRLSLSYSKTAMVTWFNIMCSIQILLTTFNLENSVVKGFHRSHSILIHCLLVARAV